MGNRLCVALLLWAVLEGIAVPAAPEDWPPISDAERALKDCPGQPGAPAICLAREQVSDHNQWTVNVFHRLKILTPAGRKYGVVEVPFSESWKVKRIEARVVRPDGQIRPFTGEPLDKTLVQVGRLKRMVKVLALPDVDVGAIVDFRYELKLDLKRAVSARSLRLERWKPEEGGIPADRTRIAYTVEEWDFDSPLFTSRAKYVYVPYNKGRISLGKSSLRLAFVTRGLVWGPPTMGESGIELEVEDIPAREQDEWMAPQEEGQMGVTFFLCDDSVTDPAAFWRQETESWRDATEAFLSADGGVAEESRTLVAGATTPLAEIKALYERAQKIENLSYVRDMTPERRKELKIKDNRGVADVLKRNTGLRSDITRAFVALARAAYFPADVVRVVSRDDKFFSENILDLYGQFDTELAMVKVDGREMFFDPATPRCPMGLVPWSCTDTPFISTSGAPGKFGTVPLDPPERTNIRMSFDLRLERAGDLEGRAALECTGQEALAVRLEYLGADDSAIKKGFEEKMAARLPAGGRAVVRSIENMNGSEEALRVDYDISLPGIATAAGDKMILPAVPIRGRWRDSFRHAQRKNSVYFPYLLRESDDIIITLPDGLTVESAPAACRGERSFARYSLATAVDEGTKIRARRELTIGKYRIAAYQYASLRTFFDQVRSGDEGQIVLSVGKK